MYSLVRKSVFAFGFLTLASAAQAAEKVALVIGNSAYTSQHALANPRNDAADISGMLRKMGFEVVEGLDVDGNGFKSKIKEFRDKLDQSSIAVFYYSGHGMQVDGHNYVVPVDAKVDKIEDVKIDMVDMDLILQVMKKDNRVSIVILDACRDNPYTRSLTRSMKGGTRGAENAFADGLAEMKSTVGSVIIYATDPGNVAQDGEGRNSPFTQAFLKYAPIPGQTIPKIVQQVSDDVMVATHDKQMPWLSMAVRKEVYLAGEPAATLQLSSLQTTADTLTRQVAPDAAKSEPAKPEAAAPETSGLACDRLASDVQDKSRNKSVPVIRLVDTEKAIPACEKAVAEFPKELRYANQLGRAYLTAERYENALRVYRDAAERGSPYATNEMGYLYYRGFGGVQKDYAQARLWFEKAASLGVPVAMSNLAFIYSHGIKIEKDQAKALAWLKKGEALNDPTSINDLAQYYLSGNGVPKDLAKARELFKRNVEQEDPEAMTQLGLMAQQGLGQAQDFDEARRWLEKAAAYDSASGMYNLGYYYLMGAGGTPVDYKLAREWFQRAMKRGDDSSMLALGHIYINGFGVEKDMAKGLELIEKSASLDNSQALMYLSHGYRDGTFGTSDAQKARDWRDKAAALDNPQALEEIAIENRHETPGESCDRLAAIPTDPLRPANLKAVSDIDTDKAIPVCEAATKAAPTQLRYANQLGRAYIQANRYADALKVLEPAAQKKSAFATLWMGNFYDRGLGVKQDAKIAAGWYEKATAQGSPDAMFNLGVDNLNGDGVVKNLDKARKLFEQASKLGHLEAMQALGNIYFTGNGVPEDNSRAREIFAKAAEAGSAKAMRRMGEIYLEGYGVKADEKLARLWFQRAANDGEVTAMLKLADIYLNSIGGQKEPLKARGYLVQAAQQNNTQAMTTLAQALLAGTFGEPDAEEARKYYEKAAALGDDSAKSWLATNSGTAASNATAGEQCDKLAGSDADPLLSVSFPPVKTVDAKLAVPACEAAFAASPTVLRYENQLARSYLEAGRDFDAVRTYRHAAEAGSVFANIWMGNLYSRGKAGLTKDGDKAAQWYVKAADLGSSVAMFNLGLWYYDLAKDNKDTEKNYAQSRQWFEKAAELGEPDSMLQLALFYKQGLGVPADETKFVEWLKKSAEFGSGEALNQLGYLTFRNEGGIGNDMTQARDYFTRAAKAGYIGALDNLAYFHLKGIGGPKDIAEAKRLLETGAAKQNVDCILSLAQGYEQGVFGAGKKADAKKYYQLAVDLGNSAAAEALAKLK